jgi:hypothetical protein
VPCASISQRALDAPHAVRLCPVAKARSNRVYCAQQRENICCKAGTRKALLAETYRKDIYEEEPEERQLLAEQT